MEIIELLTTMKSPRVYGPNFAVKPMMYQRVSNSDFRRCYYYVIVLPLGAKSIG